MKLTSEQLATLKKTELDMLVVVMDICKKLGLRYYAMYGTLLGAVRHQGFIPWDDDIDIAMPREDYEIFLSKAPALLPDHLFLQTPWSDPGYMGCFAKVRNSNTAFIESTVAHRKMNHGVFIDVFPLDYCPLDPKVQRTLVRKKKLYNYRISSEYVIPNLTWMHKAVYRAIRLLLPSVEKVLKKREALFCSTPQNDFLINHAETWRKEAILPVEWFGEGVELLFEGVNIAVPSQFHAVLTQAYGDYMQLPPEDQREAHHYVDMFDMQRSYKEYT